MTEFLTNLRKYAKILGINNIFIYGIINEINLNFTGLIDYNLEFPPKNINLNELIKFNDFIYYKGLIYREKSNIPKKNKTFRGAILEWDNSLENKKPLIFNEYSPEKFYFLMKLLIHTTEIENEMNNNFLFINIFIFKCLFILLFITLI